MFTDDSFEKKGFDAETFEAKGGFDRNCKVCKGTGWMPKKGDPKDAKTAKLLGLSIDELTMQPCNAGGKDMGCFNAESFSAEKFPNKCFICLKDAKNQRPFMEVQSEPSLADKEGNIWLCNHHNNVLDFGLFAKGNILSWTHPNGTKYRQGRLLKMNAETSDMDKKALVESEVSVKMNELFEFVQNHVGAEDGAGGDLYQPNALDEIENLVSDYFVGYWDFESRHNSNNPRYQNAETFEARDDSWCVNHGWIRGTKIGDIIPCSNCNDMICDGCRCGGCGNCETSDCCECDQDPSMNAEEKESMNPYLLGAESFSAERKKKKSGCLHFKYGKHSWAYSGNGAICIDCGLTTYIDEDGKKSYGTRSIPFKGNYDAHQAESFNAELEDCYVCDGMFKQVYVCDNDCGFQCCEIDIDGNLIPVENADGTVNDYCITCYEEKYGAETYGAESSGLTRLPSDEPNFDPQKADRNKDGKISSWERTVGNKVVKGIREGRKTSSKGIDTFAEPFEEIGISKPYARLGVIAAGITALAFGVNKLRK